MQNMINNTLKLSPLVRLLLVCMVASTGCQRTLMRPPVMFIDTRVDPFDELPADQRDAAAKIYHATDRRPDLDDNQQPHNRQLNPTLLLGWLDVEISERLSWDQLVSSTIGSEQRRRPPLRIDPLVQLGPLLTTAPPRIVRSYSDATETELQTRFIDQEKF